MSIRKCVVALLVTAPVLLPSTLRAQTCMQKLTESDATDPSNFGVSVSIDGDRMIVGARLDDDRGLNSGSAYVFRIDDNGTPSDLQDDFWVEQARVHAPVPAFADFFGSSVSITNSRLVVSARSNGVGYDSGSAHVFRIDDNGTPSDPDDDLWVYEATLTADDPAAQDHFGYPVVIRGDRIVLGAYLDDHAGDDSGAAYVFRLDNNDTPMDQSDDFWIQEAKLVSTDASAGDKFGIISAIEENHIVVGAYGSDAAGDRSGSAYVFRRDDSGTPEDQGDDTWVQEGKLVAFDAAADDFFGRSVAISGNRVLVGASSDDDAGSSSGSVYVFRRDDNGTPANPTDDVWLQEAKLVAPDAEAFDYFGTSVSLDGDLAIVGARNSDSAYVFRRDDNGTPLDPSDDSWVQRARLSAPDGDESFGPSVNIDNGRLAVGATEAAYVVSMSFESPSTDCNGNGVEDPCDLETGRAADCDGNSRPDECDIADGNLPDCNGNVADDACDITTGISQDVNDNGVPDECEIDGACCFGFDGTCTHTTVVACLASGGKPGQSGTVCWDESHPDGVVCPRFRMFWVPLGDDPVDYRDGPTVIDAWGREGETMTFEVFVQHSPVRARGVQFAFPCVLTGTETGSIDYVADSAYHEYFPLGFCFGSACANERATADSSCIYQAPIDETCAPNLRLAVALNVGDVEICNPLILFSVDLAISADAAGVFTIEFDELSTGLVDEAAEPISGLVREPLIINMGCEINTDCADDQHCTFDRCVDHECLNIEAVSGDIAGANGSCEADGNVDLLDILAVLDRHFPFAGSEVAILPILCPRIKPKGHADGHAFV